MPWLRQSTMVEMNVLPGFIPLPFPAGVCRRLAEPARIITVFVIDRPAPGADLQAHAAALGGQGYRRSVFLQYADWPDAA